MLRGCYFKLFTVHNASPLPFYIHLESFVDVITNSLYNIAFISSTFLFYTHFGINLLQTQR